MRSLRNTGAIAAVGLLSLAACSSSGGGGSTDTAAPGGGLKPPAMEALNTLGAGEGQVNVVAWAGYAEDGSNDKTVDWVHPFEKETGCKVNRSEEHTSELQS